MNYLKNIAIALGNVVDVLVPMYHGDRTKLAAFGCPTLKAVSVVLPALGAAVPVVAPIAMALGAIIPHVEPFLCGSVVAFAGAGLARKLAASQS
jgi:hypothetical protein